MENIELENRDYPPEEEYPAQEEETSFTEADNETLYKLFNNMDMPDPPTFEPTDDNPRLAAQKEEIKKQQKTEALRKYFERYLKSPTSPSAGAKSKELYDNSELILNKKGEITGLEFKGKKIIIKKNQFSKDRKFNIIIDHFNDLLIDAEEEYENTASIIIKNETGIISTPLEENVRENVSFELEEKIENLQSEIENLKSEIENLPNTQDIREANTDLQNIIFNKNLPVENKLELLEIEKKYWKDKRAATSAGPKRSFYESLQILVEYQIDKICIDNNKKPKSQEGLELLREEARNNDLARFEKFKRWAKENLLGLSAVAITIGGIITTVVMAGRRAIKQGASAFSKFANAVAKVAAKAGPLLSTLFGIISTALKWGAKGIMFLSNNLWILAVAIAYAIIETRKKTKTRKKLITLFRLSNPY